MFDTAHNRADVIQQIAHPLQTQADLDPLIAGLCETARLQCGRDPRVDLATLAD